MGALILGTGVSADASIGSSLTHAAQAGIAAMTAAKVSPADVDVVINVGIYRDNNMVEPAMAAIIQKDLGINLDYLKATTRAAAFSFDLMNAGIGALNALKVADAMLASGSAKHVLIVAGDSHPSGQKQAKFPFTTFGSAILLGKGQDTTRGVQASRFESKVHAHAGRSGMVKTGEMGTAGRGHMSVVEAPDYESSLLSFALEGGQAFVKEQGLSPTSSYLVSSQLSPAFVSSLQKGLGFAQFSDLHKQYGDAHSATFGLGLHQLKQGQSWKPGQSVVLAGASSGLATGFVHYVC